ncbi:MAG TPA: SDR family oxidoreductase [Vicinamibacterales bacterium]|nr:SDR family oxidoreductase [Vicinamibacterales bacterium]
MDLELKGKVAVITGGSRGLGLATAQALAGEGCTVVLGARHLEGLTRAAEQIGSRWRGPKVVPVTCDVSTPAGVDHLIETAVVECGGIDILVNNVGIGRGGTLEQTTDADWREAFDSTLFPAIRCSQLTAPHMRQRGGGVIVIISSIYGREAGGRMTYNVVKAAEISLTKAMAQQLARDQIRVVGVAPGSILFEGGSWWKRQQEDPRGITEFIARELPFGRFGSAQEVGNVVAFLASPKASWVSGTTVVVDGCQSRMF